MIRILMTALWPMAFLSGCTLDNVFPGGDNVSPPPALAPDRPVTIERPKVTEIEQVNYWLETTDRVMAYSPAQALQYLNLYQGTEQRPVTEYDHFRYALLNQQLRERSGWIRARDTLRQLHDSEQLKPELRWLIAILLDYNQRLINAEERRHQMALELDASQREQRELQQKITALTNLEEKMSIRKEQVNEARDQSANE